MKNLERNQKIIINISVFLTIITFIIIIVYFILNYENNDIPKINYETEEINKINKYIEELYIRKDENTKLTYKKYDNKDYITYLFKSEIKNENSIKTINYIPIVIDKINKKDLTKEEIANIFGIDLETIEFQIRNQLKLIYKKEIAKKYIDGNECDFECYLYQYRKFSNLDDIYMLSIEKDKLIAYINIINDPYALDINYFKKESELIRFEIK